MFLIVYKMNKNVLIKYILWYNINRFGSEEVRNIYDLTLKELEEYFICESAKDKWIKNSKLYKDIKNRFNDMFE